MLQSLQVLKGWTNEDGAGALAGGKGHALKKDRRIPRETRRLQALQLAPNTLLLHKKPGADTKTSHDAFTSVRLSTSRTLHPVYSRGHGHPRPKPEQIMATLAQLPPDVPWCVYIYIHKDIQTYRHIDIYRGGRLFSLVPPCSEGPLRGDQGQGPQEASRFIR